jgi:hypothetical protein
MRSDSPGAGLGDLRRAAAVAARQRLEALIDETVAESFPASDPPSWGAAGERLRALSTPFAPPWDLSGDRPYARPDSGGRADAQGG